MRVDDLKCLLRDNAGKGIQLLLPNGQPVPAHFHITEVGKVHKDFIDCGGTVRSTTACVLQVWIANDLAHRLEADKLHRILELAMPILQTDQLDVEFEYEESTVALFTLKSARVSESEIQLQFGTKHTACLAPQLCVISDSSDCNSPGCC